MLTRWGRDLDRTDPWPEHPRPQLVRDSHLSLNGPWEYAVTVAGDPPPREYDGTILVPFSPEAPLSGAGRRVGPDEVLWYRRTVRLPEGFRPPGHRVLLHLGAVDQRCRVFVDGTEVAVHEGGFLPFSADVGEMLGPDAEHELVVVVRDPTEHGTGTRGKQRLDRGGIWYTAQSGIWQPVWLEAVPAVHVTGLRLVPRLDPDELGVTVLADGDGVATVVLRAEGREVARAEAPVGREVTLAAPHGRRWSPEDPFLHDLDIVLGEDRVASYAALRTVGVGPDARGVPRLRLNGAPYLHAGVLDQGYWPDGLLTPPSDAAMVHDIATMKELGFTVLRKHVKVEPLRWYHHCDRLGMLVWQDVVNGGGEYLRPVVAPPPARAPRHLPDRVHRVFGRSEAAGRRSFEAEVAAVVALLQASPSVVVWVPFNEGWGQFDANRVAADVRRLDPTRVVDHASGWHDQGGGDLRSLHVYTRDVRLSAADLADRRAVVLSEYGGYAHGVPGRAWGSASWGYRSYDTPEALAAAFDELHLDQLEPAVAERLAGFVYTQLSDVEDEQNGLLTYDRDVLKVPAERVRAALDALRRTFASATAGADWAS